MESTKSVLHIIKATKENVVSKTWFDRDVRLMSPCLSQGHIGFCFVALNGVQTIDRANRPQDMAIRLLHDWIESKTQNSESEERERVNRVNDRNHIPSDPVSVENATKINEFHNWYRRPITRVFPNQV